MAAPIVRYRDPTALTGPLTTGQKIVAGYETDLISEPCEYAQAIDDAIDAERMRVLYAVRELFGVEASLKVQQATAPGVPGRAE